MIITVSGFPESGTTTVSENLADSLDGDVECVNGGELFRSEAKRRDMTIDEFSKFVNTHPDIDKELDGLLRAICELHVPMDSGIDPDELPVDSNVADCDYLILESRLAGWISGACGDMKVWIKASKSERLHRVDYETNDEYACIRRAWDERMRYDRWYGIDIDDKSNYDIIIRNARWPEGAVGKSIAQMLDEYTQTYDHKRNGTPVESDQFTELIPEYVYE